MPMTDATMPGAAMIGLGKMGASMARRLARAGVPLAAFDVAAAAREALRAEPGVQIVDSLAAPLSILAAIVAEIVRRRPVRMGDNLALFEKMARHYGLFHHE